MMIRRFYQWLLWLHPRRFRKEYASEMLWIFDESHGDGTRQLIGDAFASLIRQWCFRSGLDTPPSLGATPGGDGVPIFYSAASDGPRRFCLAQGAVLALLLMLTLFFLMGRGQPLRNFTIGTRTARSSLGVEMGDRGRDLDTEVKVKGAPERPSHGLLFEYFRHMPVLNAIDSDHDFVISNDEINHAAKALRRLDRDGDGKLSPEECGFEMRPSNTRKSAGGRMEDPAFAMRARRWFMRLHPMLAALDTSGDGVLSPVEIATAAAALRTLDWNSDNELTGEEVMPGRIETTRAMYFTRFDTNSDDRLSQGEIANPLVNEPELLLSADRDHDGAVTPAELFNELRRRDESSATK